MVGQLIKSIIGFGKSVVSGCHPLISLYTTRRIISSYTLHKYSEPKDISKVNIPPELKQKYSNVEINQISSKKVRDAVVEFTEVLEKEFPKDSLINFYNNINEVNIKSNAFMLLVGLEGAYFVKKNRIRYSLFSSIYHELFHMASTVYDKDKKLAFCGFQQFVNTPNIFKRNNIGRGINEGYAELLARRCFGKKHKILNNRLFMAYNFEVGVVEQLEKIVGQEDMKRYYLKADLMGLINNLKQYASEQDVLNFITDVDLVNYHSDVQFLLPNKKIKKSIKNIYSFLLKAYVTKLKKQVENGIITTDEFVEQSARYLKSLGTSVRVGGHKYKYFNVHSLIDDLEKFIRPRNTFTYREGGLRPRTI